MKLKIICVITIFVLANCFHRKAGENQFCYKNNSDCSKGLACIKIPLGKDYNDIWSFQFKCKKEDFKFDLGEYCIWKRIGSNCQKGLKCSELSLLKSGIKVGICADEKLKNKSTIISTTTEKKEEIIERNKIEDLENKEIDEIVDLFETIQENIIDKDTFTTGYIILQYFVDKDEISNNKILKLIEDTLSEETKNRKCEEIENQFDYLGSHVINLWSSEQRSKYMVG